MTTLTARCVEVMARAMWMQFVSERARPDDWPTWEELIAQGHQGMHRTNEFRGYARAALRALASEFDATVIKTMGEKPTEYQIETVRKNGGNQTVAFLHAMWADLRAAAPAFPESEG